MHHDLGSGAVSAGCGTSQVFGHRRQGNKASISFRAKIIAEVGRSSAIHQVVHERTVTYFLQCISSEVGIDKLEASRYRLRYLEGIGHIVAPDDDSTPNGLIWLDDTVYFSPDSGFVHDFETTIYANAPDRFGQRWTVGLYLHGEKRLTIARS